MTAFLLFHFSYSVKKKSLSQEEGKDICDHIWENWQDMRKTKLLFNAFLPFMSNEDATVLIWSQSDASSLSKMLLFQYFH